jgi:hypothetical protein
MLENGDAEECNLDFSIRRKSAGSFSFYWLYVQYLLERKLCHFTDYISVDLIASIYKKCPDIESM